MESWRNCRRFCETPITWRPTPTPYKVNWLDEIIARKRSDIAKMHAEEFRSRAERRDDFRDFHAAIRRRSGRVRVIAEAKSASPSAGVIAANYDPVEIAKRYEANGADAISVLTEQNYFGGTPEHLTAVREAVALPILRKDFIIDERQIVESVAIGADAILLIVAALAEGSCALCTIVRPQIN